MGARLLIDVMLLGSLAGDEGARAGLRRARGARRAPAGRSRGSSRRHDPTVPVADLRAGRLVLVRPGGRVPADGTIVEGEAAFDESMITGESKPVSAGPGDRVVAGTVATDGASGSGSRRSVRTRRSPASNASSSRRRHRGPGPGARRPAAALLFYVAVAAGVLTFVVWSAIGDTGEAVERTVTVLVISCPHALGLAIPLVIAISTGVAARAGILVRDRLALERMRTVDAVLFDKTGTLTKGSPASARSSASARPRDEVLRWPPRSRPTASTRSRARSSRRPGRTATIPVASGFRSIDRPRRRRRVEGVGVEVGGPALLRERGLEEPAEIARGRPKWRARGATVLTVVRDGRGHRGARARGRDPAGVARSRPRAARRRASGS